MIPRLALQSTDTKKKRHFAQQQIIENKINRIFVQRKTLEKGQFKQEF